MVEWGYENISYNLKKDVSFSVYDVIVSTSSKRGNSESLIACSYKVFVYRRLFSNSYYLMLGCCVWWIFSNYSTVSRLLSANSHVAANLQKVIRVLVILLKQRTWFTDDESLKIAVKAWFGSQNRKFYFQGINSWKQKLTICIDIAWEYVKKWQHVWYNVNFL